MSLLLLPGSTSFGPVINSNLGIYNFTGLSIPTPGTYQIMVYFEGFTSIVTSNFTVVYPLNSIILVTNNIKPGVNFHFMLTVNLYTLKNQYFNDSKIITLNALELGNLYSVSTNGVASFTVSFNTTGTKTIKADCMGVTNSIDILVIKNIIKIIDFIPVTTI